VTFNALVDRLGVSAVVVLDEDLATFEALAEDGDLRQRSTVGPFVIFDRRAAVTIPVKVAHDRWTFAADGAAGDWATMRVAYYPLWRARRGNAALPTRRGPAGDLEVRLDDDRGAVELRYGATGVETVALAISVTVAAAWLLWLWRAPRRLLRS